ncbi:nesprin-1 [Caerostris darwini]|uniref:Nesprin-1 n=1 Tax=Caerostris darwini TaxID=1538125 RepID=A0AAV4SGA8_9ARAC|nr:nesprin-1 [Caerostris darwini]
MLGEDISANKSAIVSHSKIVEASEQALLGELRTKEADFDVLSDESQELIAASGEMRISMGTSQLISRFQSMLLTCKELARKCEQHVEDHQQFNEKYKVCSDWIEEAAAQYAKLNVLPYSSCETLQKKLSLVQLLPPRRHLGDFTRDRVIEKCSKCGGIVRDRSQYRFMSLESFSNSSNGCLNIQQWRKTTGASINALRYHTKSESLLRGAVNSDFLFIDDDAVPDHTVAVTEL